MSVSYTRLPGTESAVPGKWIFLSFQAANGIKLPYQLRLPDGYDVKRSYPVLLFMHGLGSVGTEGKHISVRTAEVLRIVENTPEYAENTIVLAPQHPRGVQWVNIRFRPGETPWPPVIHQPENMSDWLTAAKELCDVFTTELHTDSKRFYGWGNSMGAFALWDLSTRFPDMFSAIVPVSGAGDPEKAYLIKDLPVHAFHGDADKLVDFSGSYNMIEAMKQAGAKDATLTTFSGIGHDAMECFAAAPHEPGILEWLFEKHSY